MKTMTNAFGADAEKQKEKKAFGQNLTSNN
jgi:hypothetical protein